MTEYCKLHTSFDIPLLPFMMNNPFAVFFPIQKSSYEEIHNYIHLGELMLRFLCRDPATTSLLRRC
jgi:hypothetical protein